MHFIAQHDAKQRREAQYPSGCRRLEQSLAEVEREILSERRADHSGTRARCRQLTDRALPRFDDRELKRE